MGRDPCTMGECEGEALTVLITYELKTNASQTSGSISGNTHHPNPNPCELTENETSWLPQHSIILQGIWMFSYSGHPVFWLF